MYSKMTANVVRALGALFLNAFIIRHAHAAANDTSLWSEFASVLILLVLLIVIAIGGLFFFNRRRSLFQRNGLLSVEQILSVGPHERIVVVNTKKGLLVVGVTSNQITLLTQLDPNLLSDTAVSSSADDTSH